MRPFMQFLKMLTFFFLIGIFVCSCSSTQFLRVNYQLPAKSESLQGAEVSLIFKDMRKNPAIISRSAKKELRDFSGDFTLVVGREKENGKLIGAFDLSSMLKEIFKQRLENTGINVSEEKHLETQIEFVLNEFILDYEDRNWKITMSYQTNLKKESRVVVSESVSGQAERIKVIGNKEAEKVIGELITDMVNKIDLQQLFGQVG